MAVNLGDWVAVALDSIQKAHADKTYGGRPRLLAIPPKEQRDIAAFEDYGRSGKAVLLSQDGIGQVWWCDPVGRPTCYSRFALKRNTGPITHEIWFSRS